MNKFTLATMNTRIASLFVALFCVFSLSLAFAPVANADIIGGADCAGEGSDVKTSFNWGASCAKTETLISMVFKILAGVVGIAVVIGIAWGGMLYTTSNGNASKAQAGVTAIVNSIIGLLLFIFMFAISNYIVPGGILG